jgi:cytochrome c553
VRILPLSIVLVLIVGCEQNFREPDGGHLIDPALLECAAQADGGVSSVAGVIARVNAMPHPLSGPCFVATLPRPLAVVGTTGITSAQPAGGPHDPRVFLMAPGVVIAVVTAGEGAKFIELGEWVGANTTLKAEIALPVTQAIPADEPFTRLERGPGLTACGLCHHNEEPHATIAHGRVSAAYRPEAETERSLADLAAEHQACISHGEVSQRCDMFHAIFDFGPLEQGAFAAEVKTFVESSP